MAKNVRKPIRIYRQHDLDLYYLGLSKSYHLGREMKKAVVAYANDLEYTPPDNPKEIDCTVVYKSMLQFLYFDSSDTKEKKALDLLDSIKGGYVCPFVKAVFRSYQNKNETPLSHLYSTQNGLKMTKREGVRAIQKQQSKAIVESFANSNEKNDTNQITQHKSQPHNRSSQELLNSEKISDEQINASGQLNEDTNDFNALFMQMDSLAH